MDDISYRQQHQALQTQRVVAGLKFAPLVLFSLGLAFFGAFATPLITGLTIGAFVVTALAGASFASQDRAITARLSQLESQYIGQQVAQNVHQQPSVTRDWAQSVQQSREATIEKTR